MHREADFIAQGNCEIMARTRDRFVKYSSLRRSLSAPRTNAFFDTRVGERVGERTGSGIGPEPWELENVLNKRRMHRSINVHRRSSSVKCNRETDFISSTIISPRNRIYKALNVQHRTRALNKSNRISRFTLNERSRISEGFC